MKNRTLLFFAFGLLSAGISYSQEVHLTMGIRDSIQSTVLNENRKIVVSLPKDYKTSGKNYPVLYVLDGNETLLLNSIVLTRYLNTGMIIVAIPNTNRDRDMMPLSRPSYEVKNPGGAKFLSFIGDELIPHVEKNYRSNGQRTIRGASLSGLFVMYAFIAKPELFKNYIGNSAGWFADMNTFFVKLAVENFKDKDKYKGIKLFVANSLIDTDDPKKEVHFAMIDFAKLVESELGERVSFRYVTYDTYGHVPYPSFYDGLKYIVETK
jgi:uncharacterized protein